MKIRALNIALLALVFSVSACGGQPLVTVQVAPPPSPPPPPPPSPPPPPAPHAELHENRIDISETVQFEENSDAITESSHAILDEVAHVLQAHPEITHLRVEGNTDDLGVAEHNQHLSEQRAAAVVHYLHDHGVAQTVQLDPVGFGATHPLCTEETPECRTRNRHVDFVVPEATAAATPAVGNDAAAAPHEHGHHHGHGHGQTPAPGAAPAPGATPAPPAAHAPPAAPAPTPAH